MIRMIAVAATILVLASAQGAAETERQLGPHQHGHGSLNLAVEGQTVQMELEVPGVDIVGFEHKAKTAEDRAKMEAAAKTLAQPLALFILPGEAGCKVTAAKVSIVGATEPDDDTHELDHHDHTEVEEHEADEHQAEEHGADERQADEHQAEEHGADERQADEHQAEEHGADERQADERQAEEHEADEHQAEHSEFHAEYALSCSNVAAITAISFPYFEVFPNSAELAVTLITEKGQKAFEVNREHALIDIRGIM